MTPIRFTVPGEPIPKGRPRVTRYGTYTPPRTKDYEERIQDAWRKQSGQRLNPGPIHLMLTAFFPIPKSLSRKKQLDLAGKYHTKHRGDLDNVVKAVLDALNGFAYPDDAAVCVITAQKLYGVEPRTEVSLYQKEEFT